MFDFEDDLDDVLGRGFIGLFLWGSGSQDDDEDFPCLHASTDLVSDIMFAGSNARRARDIAELVYLADRLPPGDDVCEICGGLGRTTHVVVRRRTARCGPNFDIACGTDLTRTEEQAAFWHYRRTHRVLIILMGPPCTPYCRWAAINRKYHYDGWKASLDKFRPVAIFCARVAYAQLVDGLDYLNEQPNGTMMYQEDDWQRVARHPRNLHLVVDQCAGGHRDPHSGLLVRKQSDIWASSITLLRPLEGMVCPGPRVHPEHATLRGKACADAARWPWGMASRIATGVANRLRERRSGLVDPAGVRKDSGWRHLSPSGLESTFLRQLIPRLAAALETKVNYQLLDQDIFPEKLGDNVQDVDSDGTRHTQHILVNAVSAVGRTQLPWNGVVPVVRTISHGFTIPTTTSLVSASGWRGLIGKRVVAQAVILVILGYQQVQNRRQAAEQYHDMMINEMPTTFRTPAQHHHQHHHQQTTRNAQRVGQDEQTFTPTTR